MPGARTTWLPASLRKTFSSAASSSGPISADPSRKTKLFFFLDWERSRQDYAAPVQLGGPFAGLSSSINQPFKEHDAFGRLDWQATDKLKVFYRYTYNINSNVVPYIPDTFQPFLNRDHAQDHLAGFDLTTGKFTHSFRFEFLRFANADQRCGGRIGNLQSCAGNRTRHWR